MTENICGYKVYSDNLATCIDEIAAGVCGEAPQKTWLACANPHSLHTASDDKEFSGALHQADFLVPDGVGVVLASKLLGGSISDRITGSDIFEGLSHRFDQQPANQRVKYFFLGSTNETLAKIQAKLAQDYPNIECVGVFSPPYKPVFSQAELDEMVEVINQSGADVLWVGMTAPKQEKWIASLIARLDIRFAAAVGAVFDFYVGNVERSPAVYQKLGLEWLPRLVQEPKRLWRRVFVSGPAFGVDVIKQRFAR